ncbi:MAG: protein kinase [Microcoleus sp.]
MIPGNLIHPGLLLQGRYRVIDRIGGGGFGDIFEVDDGGTIKVLKVLNLDNFNNPDIKQKATILFQREAEFLMSQRHPGIPRVQTDGYFTFPEGSSKPLPCLVMEKIPGKNLQEWMLANQPITTETAIDWLTQLTKILSLLHDCKYFHRDIKPSNIMLKPEQQLVLVDFGAVREVTETYLRQQKDNYTGTAIISAGYTPSEQAEGHAVPQSDFFALGRTFVYLLTGKSPIELPKDSENGQLIWRDKATDVAPHLADLIDTMMAPFFGKRPQDCQEILQILARGDSRSPLESLAQPLTEINHSIEPSKTNAIQYRPSFNWVGKLALACWFLLALGGLWTLSPQIVYSLNKEGFLNYKSKRLNNAELYYKTALVFQPNDGIVNYNLGALYEDKQEYDLARTAYQISVNAGFNQALNNLARLEILDKQYAKALPLLEKALPLATDIKTTYTIHKNLGWAQLELGRYEEANTNLTKAINISSDRSVAYCLEAVLLERQGNKQASISNWKKCSDRLPSESPEEQRWVRQNFSKSFEKLQLNSAVGNKQ